MSGLSDEEVQANARADTALTHAFHDWLTSRQVTHRSEYRDRLIDLMGDILVTESVELSLNRSNPPDSH